MDKYCFLCNKKLSPMTKGNKCRICISIQANQKICLNNNCNNKIKRKERKYCSRKCMREYKSFLKYEEEYFKSNNISNNNYCEIHNLNYKGDSCIKCDLEKQQLDYKKKIKKGWKMCSNCNTNFIMKNKSRCRDCIEKHFKNKKFEKNY